MLPISRIFPRYDDSFFTKTTTCTDHLIYCNRAKIWILFHERFVNVFRMFFIRLSERNYWPSPRTSTISDGTTCFQRFPTPSDWRSQIGTFRHSGSSEISLTTLCRLQLQACTSNRRVAKSFSRKNRVGLRYLEL